MKRFASKETQKTYWALIAGVPSHLQGTIDAPLVKDTDALRGQERMSVDNEHPDAKRAITEYRVIDRLGKKLSWVELKPLTGRTHQLRVHLEYLGHPIIGDGKYGGAYAFPEGMNLPQQLHLHAREIMIPPREPKGKPLKITAPLPPQMQQSWQMLGLEWKG
jgi:23S rRNA pseudouridine955/2504/2580 synthase